jgi:signal transduction histidine kinase
VILAVARGSRQLDAGTSISRIPCFAFYSYIHPGSTSLADIPRIIWWLAGNGFAYPCFESTMTSRKKARLAFASALILLVVSGVASFLVITRLLNSAKWVAHTYQVEVTLGEIQSLLSTASQARTGFVNTGDPATLSGFEPAKKSLHQKLTELRELIRDNPIQQANSLQLEDITLRRIELLDTAVQIRKNGPIDESTMIRLSGENVAAAADFSNSLNAMIAEEQRLLQQRSDLIGALWNTAKGILAAAFALSVFLFWVHFRLLTRELLQREETEASARSLSARVLQLQDEERRKFSRELHDSLGQLLALAKMHLSVLIDKNPQDELLAEIDKLLSESVTETRTISHLLHPPLLDEVGVGSAARWYAEGFAKRSGIDLTVDIPEDLGRLPRPAELVLFRVLQESLTNIHRHSKSTRAEVSLRMVPNGVLLRIRDYGSGMSADTLRHFRSTGTRVGVGLAGMRERVREQGGQLDIQSSSTGTTVSVTLPVTPADVSDDPFRATASAD